MDSVLFWTGLFSPLLRQTGSALPSSVIRVLILSTYIHNGRKLTEEFDKGGRVRVCRLEIRDPRNALVRYYKCHLWYCEQVTKPYRRWRLPLLVITSSHASRENKRLVLQCPRQYFALLADPWYARRMSGLAEDREVLFDVVPFCPGYNQKHSCHLFYAILL